MEITHFTFTKDELERFANQVLEVVESTALADGIITEPNAFTSKFVITVVQLGRFTKYFDALMGWIGAESKNKSMIQVLYLPQKKQE